jgi:hypothetical protein
MFFHRSLLLEIRTFAVVPLVVLALSSPWGSVRRGELFVAWSADDPSLSRRIAVLSPTVSPDEARRVAYTAYMTGRELHREWRGMASRHSELSCQYGKEKRGTLFSVGNGASRPIGCTEAANARAPLGRVGSQYRCRT